VLWKNEPFRIHLVLCNLLAARNCPLSTVEESFDVVKDKEKPLFAAFGWDKNGTE
jgi:hypothetical protein